MTQIATNIKIPPLKDMNAAVCLGTDWNSQCRKYVDSSSDSVTRNIFLILLFHVKFPFILIFSFSILYYATVSNSFCFEKYIDVIYYSFQYSGSVRVKEFFKWVSMALYAFFPSLCTMAS